MIQLTPEAPTVSNTGFDYSWPAELKDWHEAYTAAADALTHIESRESALHQALEAGHLVTDEDRQELRELAYLAYNLKQRIDAVGSKVLAQWDDENCTWKAPSKPSAPAEPTPANGDLRISHHPNDGHTYTYGIEYFHYGLWCTVMSTFDAGVPLRFMSQGEAEQWIDTKTSNAEIPF